MQGQYMCGKFYLINNQFGDEYFAHRYLFCVYIAKHKIDSWMKSSISIFSYVSTLTTKPNGNFDKDCYDISLINLCFEAFLLCGK